MAKYIEGIPLKKKFGQHFLRDATFTDIMLRKVSLTNESSVLEIGCGNGFLTKAILQYPLARLWVFEIDSQWADYVKKSIQDERLVVFQENILDFDFNRLREYKPWTLLSNLPYQITFPILYLVARHHDFFAEGVVMIQEEVAQKIIKKSGRGYGFPSLFLQYYFELKLLNKVPPHAFYPQPKVYSRLLYFKPKRTLIPIEQEAKFWQFIKACFRQPRRTLKNNLQQTHIDITKIPHDILQLRAQQMSFEELKNVWHQLISAESAGYRSRS